MTRRQKAALVVGVDEYDDAQIRNLSYAESDCIALQGFLRYRAEFEQVVFLHGPKATSDTVLDTAAQLAGTLSPGDLFLFYFAGHGVDFEGSHLLLCRAARFSRLRHTQQHAIPVKLLREETEVQGVDRVFVLDACRSDLLMTRGAGGQGMTGTHALRDIVLAPRECAVASPGSLAVLCSCAEGQQAGELTGDRHGLFTKALLDELGESLEKGGELTVSDKLENALYQRMLALSRRHGLGFDQRPWIQRSGPAPVLIDAPATPVTTAVTEFDQPAPPAPAAPVPAAPAPAAAVPAAPAPAAEQPVAAQLLDQQPVASQPADSQPPADQPAIQILSPSEDAAERDAPPVRHDLLIKPRVLDGNQSHSGTNTDAAEQTPEDTTEKRRMERPVEEVADFSPNDALDGRIRWDQWDGSRPD